MKLSTYNLSLNDNNFIQQSIVGNFLGKKSQEILVNKTGSLELLTLNLNTIKIKSFKSFKSFSLVRNIAKFRLTGSRKDLVVLTSDSGKLSILEYLESVNDFKILHQETFGKSGIRRIIPGLHLATDPKGRSLMISAIEKSKLVYVLNRDSDNNITISSPLEFNRNFQLIQFIVGLDVGFENPLYASLEIDYEDIDQDPTSEALKNVNKFLTYYELDLGLNHVVKKYSEPTDPQANLLIQVPGGQSSSSDRFDGPSGVLVCCKDYIMWNRPNYQPHRIPIPKRSNNVFNDNEGTIIVSSVLHKMKGAFFFLLQSDLGDLFKLTMEVDGEDLISLRIKYFDTIPISNSINILKSGYLFSASEYGNHQLYQFQKLGDDDNELEYSSRSYENFGMPTDQNPLPINPAYFNLKPLDNLVLVDEINSLAPIIDAKVQSLYGNETPQIYTACGRGSRSSLRVLRHGLDVIEAVSSDLPAPPIGIWTLKLRESDIFDSYIVLSFVNGTLILGIGESIEEVSNTGLSTSLSTITVQQIGTDSLLQVHHHGIKHITYDKKVNDWKAPSNKQIVKATTNKRQCVIGLNTGEIFYFEMDNYGQLNEFEEMKNMESNILCMSIGEVEIGKQRYNFLAIGCDDQTIRIISLDPQSTLETISVQAVTALPQSITISQIYDSSIDKYNKTNFVNIGLNNGVLLRTTLDQINGNLTDSRSKFLGPKGVNLTRIKLINDDNDEVNNDENVQNESEAVIALSNRSYLNYSNNDKLQFTPLLYDSLDQVSSFSAELCPQGLIGISESVLRIFTIPDLNKNLNQSSIKLNYTPRKLLNHPYQTIFYTIESDHRTISKENYENMLTNKGYNMDNYYYDSEQFGNYKAPEGHWGSCIRIIDPNELKTVKTLELDNNEAAFSAAIVNWSTMEDELHLVIGTVKDRVMTTQTFSQCYLRVYKLSEDGKDLEFLHKTDIDDVPYSLHPFKGKLLAGVGKALRIYEIGKKKLLRKCENNSFSTAVININSIGSRIYVGDMQESVSYAVYKAPENKLIVFADDTNPRWTTASVPIDYDSVAGGDKFGNIFINRIDRKVGDSVDDDETGAGITNTKGLYHGAPYRSELLAHFFVGDIVTSITKATLSAGGREILIYTCLHGTIGMIIPFVSKDDVEFLSTLELHMRQELPNLCGRDHLAFRSYYVPVKACVDGDLCENYSNLNITKQQVIANDLDRTVGEVLKKVESLRMTAGF